MRRRRSLVLPGVLALGLGVAATGCSSSAAPSSRALEPPSLPLANGVHAESSAPVVVLPMGDLGHEVNTFWQVVTAGRGPGHWALATPKGVADNGGLVAATAPWESPGPVLVGVLTSELLKYSPLAATATAGRAWTPGLLPGPLAPGPTTLASLGQGRYAAIVGRDGTAVVTTAGSLARWTTLVSLARLRATSAAKACDLQALTAVGETPGGTLLVGGRCAGRGRIGLFERRSGSWHEIAPRLTGAVAPSVSSVEMLKPAGSGDQAIVGVARRGPNGQVIDGLVGLSGSAAAGWQQSRSVIYLTNGAHVQAVAEGQESGLAVVMANGSTAEPTGERLEVLESDVWRSEGNLPMDTQAVSLDGGHPTAFLVERSTLTIEGRGTTGWHRVQQIHVPIEYGSSS